MASSNSVSLMISFDLPCTESVRMFVTRSLSNSVLAQHAQSRAQKARAPHSAILLSSLLFINCQRSLACSFLINRNDTDAVHYNAIPETLSVPWFLYPIYSKHPLFLMLILLYTHLFWSLCILCRNHAGKPAECFAGLNLHIWPFYKSGRLKSGAEWKCLCQCIKPCWLNLKRRPNAAIFYGLVFTKY